MSPQAVTMMASSISRGSDDRATSPPQSSPGRKTHSTTIRPHRRQSVRYIMVKPSTVVKTAEMARIRRTPAMAPTRQDLRMRLDAEECRISRRKKLEKLARQRVDAEALLTNRQLQENKLLDNAAEQGLHWAALEPQMALSLARAVRSTLSAEEAAAKSRAAECEGTLETLRDDVDALQARLKEADRQVGLVMDIIMTEHISVDFRLLDPSGHLVICAANPASAHTSLHSEDEQSDEEESNATGSSSDLDT